MNHDGVADIAVGQGPGSRPAVTVLNGKSGAQLASYAPFAASFRSGVSVALGDVDHDGRADLVVGTGAGTPAQVKVYSGKTHALLETLSPFGATFRGGVSVAAGDVNGDGTADVIVGTGSGVSSQVKVFSGATSTPLESLAPFKASFQGGVTVAAGDVDGDGKADVIVGSGPGATDPDQDLPGCDEDEARALHRVLAVVHGRRHGCGGRRQRRRAGGRGRRSGRGRRLAGEGLRREDRPAALVVPRRHRRRGGLRRCGLDGC